MNAADGVDVVGDTVAELGECPVWDERTDTLVWVDIVGRRIMFTDPDDGATSHVVVPSDVGAVAPRSGGGFIAALQDGFWVVDDDGIRPFARLEPVDPTVRCNDAACDPHGRFWAGTVSSVDESLPVGRLHRLDADGSVTTHLDGVTISNGLGWSPDGATMYYIDTPTHRVDAFDYDGDTGTISARRTVVAIDPDLGAPDGMTVDEDGGIWVALWGGGAVHRYVDGELDQVIEVPVSQPTSCAFGGPGRDELYITSAWRSLSEEARAREPLAGRLFRAQPGVRGLPASPFG